MQSGHVWTSREINGTFPAMRLTRTFAALYGFVVAGFLPPCVSAEDLEQRWRTLLETGNHGAQLVELEARGQTFYGLYEQNLHRNAKGVVLILHDHNQHPDWPFVIRPLRAGLPAFGWATLAIQLPVSHDALTEEDYTLLMERSATRIHTAVQYLQSKGNWPLAIVGYGMGARMAVETLGKETGSVPESLILVSMDSPEAAPSTDPGRALFNIEIPVLDIVGSYEKNSVLAAARERKQHRDKMYLYRSLVIAGANHEYERQQDVLVKRIRGWLSRTLEQMKTRP